MIHEAAAKGFESGSDAYERGRPSFPKEAVDRMALEIGLARPGALIVDLGAGTGKFTELLAEHPLRRADLVAVEPVRAMREKLIGKKLAGCRVVEGAAERLPFGDASVDAVTVAQAFHWFDGDRALAELARVLKPGGKLALV
ncbi:MAG: methyltransferase domain-containing protein, partial [Deltaproteobacteria bacterium]|nr:methyltransferase domain-containing protein [Deltaproteobacteria bacterium]